MPGSPVSVPALGITYKVLNIVQQTDKDSPAARAELTKDGEAANVALLAPNDEIVSAEVILPPAKKDDEKDKQADTEAIVNDAQADRVRPGDAQLAVLQCPTAMAARGQPREADLEGRPHDHAGPGRRRGLVLRRSGSAERFGIHDHRADSLAQAASLGGRETVDAVLHVYMFLRKIGTQISPFVLGGPKTIAEAAGSAAYRRRLAVVDLPHAA